MANIDTTAANPALVVDLQTTIAETLSCSAFQANVNDAYLSVIFRLSLKPLIPCGLQRFFNSKN